MDFRFLYLAWVKILLENREKFIVFDKDANHDKLNKSFQHLASDRGNFFFGSRYQKAMEIIDVERKVEAVINDVQTKESILK